MGLDISKIQNEDLKKIAYIADADNNMVLDNKEFSVFKAEACEKEGISTEDFNQAMGLYKTEAAATTEATTQEETVTAAVSNVKTEAVEKTEEIEKVNVSKGDRKIFEANITNFIKQMTKYGATPEDLLEDIQGKYSSGFYKEVADDVIAVIKAVQDTKYDSKEDVKKIKKAVEKGLNSFQKDILDEIITAAESDQILKEAEELTKIYDEVKQDESLYTENKNGEKVLNMTNCENAVNEGLSKKGIKNESYYSGKAFDLLKDYIKQEAMAIHDNKASNTEGRTRRKVLKEILKTNAKGDEYAKKATRKGKEVQEIAANHNNYKYNLKKLEAVSSDELKKELGKELFGKLAATYLNEKNRNEDGTFNVCSLAEKILYRVGYDYTMNQSKDIEMSELRNVQVELKELTGQDFSESEVKKLANFCAIKIERNDHNPLKGLKNAITAATTSAIAAFNSRPVLHVNPKTINITVNIGLAEQIKEQFGNLADITELGNCEVLIRVHQEAFKDTRFLDALAGAGIGVLGAALLQMIFGEGKEFEKSCISDADFDFSNSRYTNIEEYEEYIKGRYPKAKANAIIALAKLCEEDGKYSPEKFDSMMKHIAGTGSNLNCKELKGGSMYYEKEKEEKTEVKPEEKCDDKKENCNVLVTKKGTEATEKTEDLTKVHKTTYGDTWRGLVEAYYPDLYKKYGEFYGKNGAIRALKEALADGDKEVLDKLINGGDLPSIIKLPASINGVERQDGTVKKVKVQGNGKASVKEVGKDDIKITIIPGTLIWEATDGCDGTKASGSSREEAVENLKKTTQKEYDKVIEQ